MDTWQILLAVAAVVVGSGGIYGGITAFSDIRKANAEVPLIGAQAQDLIIKNLQDENRRLIDRVRSLEVENAELKIRVSAFEQRLHLLELRKGESK